MPATRINQLAIAASVLGGAGIIYRLLKELLKDIVQGFKKLLLFAEKWDKRLEWLDGIQSQYPDVVTVIEKLKKLNGNGHPKDATK